MYTETPFTLYASVSYLPLPWKKVAFEDGLIRCIELGPSDKEELKNLWNPVDKEPRFWLDVRSMAFRFQDGDRIAIGNFYRRYGGFFELPANTSEIAERWDEVAAALNWFRHLTLLVEWAKERRIGPLREVFESAQYERRNEDGSPAKGSPLILYGYPTYIRFVPWLTINIKRQETLWRYPSTDDEFCIAAWQAAVNAAQRFMRNILILPHTQDDHAFSPVATFTFYARGALQAAFLQWFFRELASVNVTPCEAKGCKNPVLPPRKRFCSETCRQREKKRRQRMQARERTNRRLGAS